MKEIKAKFSDDDNKIEIEGFQNPWEELGYWLEATGFMLHHARKQRDDKTKEQLLDYCRDYLERCIDDWAKIPTTVFLESPEPPTT